MFRLTFPFLLVPLITGGTATATAIVIACV